MKRFRFGWRSWGWRVLALLVLATFPLWWILVWCDERRYGKGFWRTGWSLLSSVVAEIATGED